MSLPSVTTASQAPAAAPVALGSFEPSRPRPADGIRTRTPRREPSSRRRARPGLVAWVILALGSLGLAVGVVLHVMGVPGSGGWLLGSLVGITFGTGLLAAVVR